MAKKNILQEAIAEANQIKEAAVRNASSVLIESLKDNVKDFINEQLDEEYEEMEEGFDMVETPALDVDDDMDDDEGEDEDDLGLDFGSDDEDEDEDLEEGLTEEDLEEALQETLALVSEVEHGSYGDMEFVDQSKHADSRGLDDFDSKEKGWEEEEGEAVGSTELYGKKGAYHQESRKVIAKLVKENKMLKKANVKLKEAIQEINTFNKKVFFANQLLQKVQKEGLNLELQHKIIEQFDEVNTAQEAKRIYEVWNTVLGKMSGKASKGNKKSLSESLGLRNEQQNSVQKDNGDAMKNRFALLAGLCEDEY